MKASDQTSESPHRFAVTVRYPTDRGFKPAWTRPAWKEQTTVATELGVDIATVQYVRDEDMRMRTIVLILGVLAARALERLQRPARAPRVQALKRRSASRGTGDCALPGSELRRHSRAGLSSAQPRPRRSGAFAGEIRRSRSASRRRCRRKGARRFPIGAKGLRRVSAREECRLVAGYRA